MMERKHVLQGIRVVDFSHIVAGPTCTRILADFGAEVIRVEFEQTLDYCRYIPPVMPGDGPNRSGSFNDINRNKLGVTLNAMHPKGMDLLQKLITVSDVVVENFSSRVLDIWGLDYDAQCKLRPDIIYASLSGFGHSGSNRDYTTWGPSAQALSGLTYMSGLPGEEPAGWGFSYMDLSGGYYGAIACLMALHHRNRTGEGQWVDMSQVEAGIVLTGSSILDFTVNGRPYRRPGNPPGNRSTNPTVAPHNTYRCKGEDRWCVITVFNDEQWESFVDALGAPAWASDERYSTNQGRVENQDDLDRHIESWTRDRTPHEVMATLQAAGVPAGAVQDSKDKVENDPQLEARDYLPAVDHPEIGRGRVEGVPLKMSRSPWELRRAAPLLGEHREYVYQEVLGIEEAELVELAEEGVI